MMKVDKNDRGFGVIYREKYQNDPGVMTRLLQESSAIGDYENSYDLPGSSYLFVGQDHHLNREEVADLINHMTKWLKEGRI